MKISDCHHVRIRDTNDYNMNVENYIKAIEKQYNIDFRSLPQWKYLIQRLHVMTTDCKRKIQDSNRRKIAIIDKICLQWNRISPFELTDNLARTSKLWRKLESDSKKRRVSLKPEPEIFLSPIELSERSVEVSETAHQNTEVVLSEEHIEAKLKPTVETDVKTVSSLTPTHLPTSIHTNPNKILSPLNPKDKSLFKETVFSEELVLDTETRQKPWIILKPSLAITNNPEKLIIDSKCLKEQTIKFSLMNCTTEHIHTRFVCATDESCFRYIKVLPETNLRLYPGIAVPFKFIFKLAQNEKDFESSLYFKVGHNVLTDAPYEACQVQILSKFKETCLVSVSETISIPPVYLWHIKPGQPKAIVTVCVNDGYDYHVHIEKHVIDLSKVPDENSVSLEVVAPTSQSLIQRMEDEDIEIQSNIMTSTLINEHIAENECIKLIDVVSLVISDIIELCLDTFIFEHTYLYMKSHSKISFPVYFSKPQHIGKHQLYYDVKFRHAITDDIVSIIPIKVFSEVLSHPIRIDPCNILDMSCSPVNHGYCEDRFVITNSHKLYPARIKVKLTTKMKKLFTVTPMETLIPTTSSVDFQVRICSRDFMSANRCKDFAIFTIKIIVTGNKEVYSNVPPMFYEIIAPCALEFKMVYNEHYFKEVLEKSQIE